MDFVLGCKRWRMKDREIEKLTLKQLTELKERIDRLISTKAADERNKLREQFATLASDAGFSLDEVVGLSRGGRAAGSGRGSGTKRPAAYVNPGDSSQTWSGRGRMPKWLSERVKAGADVAEFKI